MTSKQLTLGSLFDGSGGFTLGAKLCGIKPIWASEIEPFPIRVTSKRMPEVVHLGDITKLKGGEVPPVDIISFGSPCQDLSIAGKRSGLDGSKSSLFFEAIRVVDEMREKTNGRYPRFIVWENVCGAFSSSKGEDFRCVLESIVQIKDKTLSISKPNKWQKAGSIVGDGFSVCWRVLDAQYFGVPQRRRRVFLVADFASTSSREVLFEPESLCGDTKQSEKTKQATATNFENGTQVTVCLNDQGGSRMDVSVDKTHTLRANAHHPPIVFENHSQDTRYTQLGEVAPSVLSTYGTGGNNQPLCVSYDVRLTSDNTKNVRHNVYKTSTVRTLDTVASNPDSNQGGVAVVVLQGSMIGRTDKSGPNGSGVGSCVSYTLNTVDRHGVVYGLDRESFNASDKFAKTLKVDDTQINSTLKANGPSAVVYSASKNTHFTHADENLASSLLASDYKDPPIVSAKEFIVRRLTPSECASLQGFPTWWCEGLSDDDPSAKDIDFYTEVFETYRTALGRTIRPKTQKQIIKWLNSPHSDSAEYKMWGNGVALPCVCFVLSSICKLADLT